MDRGIRLALEGKRPIAHVARDLGIEPESLRRRIRRAEIDAGIRECLTSSEREELRRLRRENFELRRSNEILKSASLFFARELDPDRPKMSRYSSTRLAWGSSRSAGPWPCRPRRITSAPPENARHEWRRMSG